MNPKKDSFNFGRHLARLGKHREEYTAIIKLPNIPLIITNLMDQGYKFQDNLAFANTDPRSNKLRERIRINRLKNGLKECAKYLVNRYYSRQPIAYSVILNHAIRHGYIKPRVYDDLSHIAKLNPSIAKYIEEEMTKYE